MTWRQRVAALPVAVALVVGLAGPAAAAQARQLRPHILVIQVVPAMAGVGFTLDGRAFTSDASGVASITMTGIATRRLAVSVPPSRDGLRYKFQRWAGGHGGDEFSTGRTVRMGGRVTRLVAGFGVECMVGWRFVDGNGDPVPKSVVQSVVLKDDTGARYQKPADGYHWLPARQVVRENSGHVTARRVAYSVEGVMVDGANAVFRSQQRFHATPRASWTMSVRFYEMQIGVHDAVFRFPTGSAVQLRSPNGRVQRLDLDERSRASSGRLARGDYQLKVRGPGVSWWTPVSLSRTQEVELELLSWLDLGVAALAGLVVLVGLPLLGRRLHQRGRRAVAGAAVADRDVLEQAKP